MEYIKCKCGKKAQWIYMPGDDPIGDFKCNDCVPRGCSCREEFVNEEDYFKDNPDGPRVSLIDDNGRLLPCCEWEYEENGFPVNEYRE